MIDFMQIFLFFVKKYLAFTRYAAFLFLNLTSFILSIISLSDPRSNRPVSFSRFIALQQTLAFDWGVKIQKANSSKISSSLPFTHNSLNSSNLLRISLFFK